MIQEIKILDELSLDTTKTEGKPAGLVALFQIKADSTVKDGCAFIFALVDYSLPVKTIIDLYIEKRKGHFNVYNSESGDISFSINREEKVELSGAWFQTQGVLLYELEGKAEQYVVALMRPAKTGDTYRMQATCRQTERMKRIRDGQDEGQNKNVEYSLELEAGVRILEVSKTGDVTKFSLTVTNFTKTQDAAKTTLIPKDSLVMGYVDDAGYGFTINENPVGSETHQALCAVIQLGKGGRWSDDEIYDSKEPQKVGNSWKINSAVAARNLAKTGLNAQVDTITGTATLEQVTEIEGTPCLKVRGEMSIKGMSMPSIPDFKVESAEMQMAYSATFPADITKGRIQESQEMRMTCSMRGNPPAAGGAIVLVQSTAERTLTTKMTYPK
jgi:hypothetical protein